jgi:hypothetical protein
MRISFTDELDDGRILQSIGRVSAASAWRAANAADNEAARDAALKALIARASEFDADAIVGVDFSVDGGSHVDLASVELKRVTATGIAVRLARAA